MADPNLIGEMVAGAGSALNRPVRVAKDYRAYRCLEAIEASTTDSSYEEMLAGDYLAGWIVTAHKGEKS